MTISAWLLGFLSQEVGESLQIKNYLILNVCVSTDLFFMATYKVKTWEALINLGHLGDLQILG